MSNSPLPESFVFHHFHVKGIVVATPSTINSSSARDILSIASSLFEPNVISFGNERIVVRRDRVADVSV